MSNPFIDKLKEMGRDEKATCKGCDTTYHTRQYKKGFCDTCQKDGTYESHQQQVNFHLVSNFVIKAIGICGIIFIIIALIFGHSK